MEEVALFFHLLGAFLFVAGFVLTGIAFERARRRERPEEVALLLALGRSGVLLVGVGGPPDSSVRAVAPPSRALGLRRRLGRCCDPALPIALALGGVGGQRPKRARQLAGQLAAQGEPISEELRELLDDRASRLANYGSSLSVLAIIALLVFK